MSRLEDRRLLPRTSPCGARRRSLLVPMLAAVLAGSAAADGDKPVSFFREVRPILTAKCAGCHQPAKAGGKIVLTSHAAVLGSGKADLPNVVAGKPEESALLAVLLPRDGKPPTMPKDGDPLTELQIDVLRRWIAEGAIDDTAQAASEQFSMERPPVYQQLPVVPALDFSPDGSRLAVAGYHEVLLYEVGLPGGFTLSARLVGLSERIESVEFSPDGAELLVVGGSPGRLGEVQLWVVDPVELRLSIPAGFDTLYGGSWSHDGRFVAFGGGDHTLRALDADDGKQVFFNAASEDLVLDTAFSADASHLVSVGRDRALKLFQFATQQFIDNVTSITPGALKGGLMSVDRRPGTDELLVCGADGAPKLYQMHRTKNRQIGDDYNLLKAFAAAPGRVFSVEWAADGARFVAAVSTGHAGEVRLHAADQEAPVWTLPMEAPIYAATWRPKQEAVDAIEWIAAAGFDGRVHVIDARSGALLYSFDAAPLAAKPTSPVVATGAPGEAGS